MVRRGEDAVVRSGCVLYGQPWLCEVRWGIVRTLWSGAAWTSADGPGWVGRGEVMYATARFGKDASVRPVRVRFCREW